MTREAARMRVLSDRRWAPARALRCSHRRGGGGLGGPLEGDRRIREAAAAASRGERACGSWAGGGS